MNEVCLRLRRYLETELVSDLIDENKQMGLTGELFLLRKMIELAREEEDLTEQDALSCWQGFESEFEETRDFGNSDSKIIIEAKMTKDKENRSHIISNWKQLWAQEGESLYVFSGSLRPAKTGEEYWLQIAQEIEEYLVDASSINEFRQKMETQGVPVEQWNSYKGESPYMVGFEFALIKITDEMKILRKNSFADGFGPDDEGSVIREPQYTLDLTAQEKIYIDDDDEEFDQILIRMMKTSNTVPDQ